MRVAIAVVSPARAVAALAAAVAAGLAGCTSPAPQAGPAVGAARTSVPRSPSPSGAPSRLSNAFRLLPAHGRGHLATGSDPRALPGDVLIADEDNRRLLLVDPHGRIRWRFPSPGALGRDQAFGPPDDAFVSANGRSIAATQEMNDTISVIDIATGRITRRYGHPGVAGPGPGYFSHPDDAMLLPGGEVLAADIQNCRILLLSPRRITRQFGNPLACGHEPPRQFGQPNGAFPLKDGHFLITEILGDWVAEMSLRRPCVLVCAPARRQLPVRCERGEPGPLHRRRLLPSGPGGVNFTRTGHVVWRFRPTGAAALNHPSLALPLPNGNVLVNDDYNDRVIVISRKTNRIVWQYGHDGVPGRAAGYLNNPDGVNLAPPQSLLMTHAATMGRP